MLNIDIAQNIAILLLIFALSVHIIYEDEHVARRKRKKRRKDVTKRQEEDKWEN